MRSQRDLLHTVSLSVWEPWAPPVSRQRGVKPREGPACSVAGGRVHEGNVFTTAAQGEQ